MPGQVLGRANGFSIFSGQWKIAGVTCQFVQIPDATGKKSTAPIGISAVIYRSISIESYRIETFSACFDGVDGQTELCFGKFYISLMRQRL